MQISLLNNKPISPHPPCWWGGKAFGENMKVKQLHKMSFDDAVEKLYEESNEITSYDILKDFIKEKIDEDNILLALHLLNAIWEDTSVGDSNYYKYDYTCGTLDTPKALNTLEDLEEFCED